MWFVVYPLHKKCVQSDFCNCRPISLLPIFGNIVKFNKTHAFRLFPKILVRAKSWSSNNTIIFYFLKSGLLYCDSLDNPNVYGDNIVLFACSHLSSSLTCTLTRRGWRGWHPTTPPRRPPTCRPTTSSPPPASRPRPSCRPSPRTPNGAGN